MTAGIRFIYMKVQREQGEGRFFSLLSLFLHALGESDFRVGEI